MKNKIKPLGLIALVSVALVAILIGCAHSHTQSIRNETGQTVTEVYIRATGTNDWGNVRNVVARRNAENQIIRTHDGQVAFWDRNNMNHGTQLVFFTDSSSSETPRGIRNQDIYVVDSNGIRYMKHNVPITFTTTKLPFMFGRPTVINASEPITFTVEDRLPMLFVLNQTGHTVTLTAPVRDSINNQGRTQFQPTEMNRPIDVTYRIGQAQYTEQVTMNNADATVTLTRRPPTLTIVNNVGATINTIFLRVPGAPSWVGGNIVIRGGTVHLAAAGGAQTGDISGSIVNRDNMRLWLGNVNLSGDVFDIRIDDVQGNSYVRSNVQIANDMTITFTQNDRR